MLNTFLASKPSDSSGPRAANRFDFQLSWAFCLLLDLESKDQDYLMVLDYHDDIVVFDAEADPKSASFFQVKSETRKHWTLARLLERADGAKYSILGKLYLHRRNFETAATSLYFVTNYLFSLPKAGSKEVTKLEYCSISELCEEAQSKIRDALKEEHDLQEPPIIDFEFFLKTDELPSKTHATYAEGKFSQFLTNRFGENTYPISNAFRSLRDLLRRRNNYEFSVENVEELKKTKAISRSEFSNLLNRMARARNVQAWDTVEKVLVNEGFGILAINRFKREWESWEIQLMDSANATIQKTQDTASAIIQAMQSVDPNISIREIFQGCSTQLLEKLRSLSIPPPNDVYGVVLSHLTHLLS